MPEATKEQIHEAIIRTELYIHIFLNLILAIISFMLLSTYLDILVSIIGAILILLFANGIIKFINWGIERG